MLPWKPPATRAGVCLAWAIPTVRVPSHPFIVPLHHPNNIGTKHAHVILELHATQLKRTIWTSLSALCLTLHSARHRNPTQIFLAVFLLQRAGCNSITAYSNAQNPRGLLPFGALFLQAHVSAQPSGLCCPLISDMTVVYMTFQSKSRLRALQSA